jgi:hypothetical protein
MQTRTELHVVRPTAGSTEELWLAKIPICREIIQMNCGLSPSKTNRMRRLLRILFIQPDISCCVHFLFSHPTRQATTAIAATANF